MEKIQRKKTKKILIIGNMSSGKSTLINSILKENILPTSNQACTAKEIKITVSNKRRFFSYYIGEKRRSLKKEGSLKVSTLNNSSEISKIEIIGPSYFRELEGYEIYDSPGPNNSIDIKHKDTTLNILKNGEFERVIFVFNAGNLFTIDDKILLETLLKEKYGIRKEIVVVVNKMDKIHISEESTDEEVTTKVKDFLKKIGIKKYKVFLYSSVYFFLKKNVEKNKSEKRFLNLLEEIYDKNKIKELKQIRKKIFLKEGRSVKRRENTRNFKLYKI